MAKTTIVVDEKSLKDGEPLPFQKMEVVTLKKAEVCGRMISVPESYGVIKNGEGYFYDTYTPPTTEMNPNPKPIPMFCYVSARRIERLSASKIKRIINHVDHIKGFLTALEVGGL